jgi:hypothetical protein
MPRIRTVKPEFFKHYDLFSLEKEHQLPIRLAFQGLWLCADKEGIFRWIPQQLKLDILPYDEIDFEKVLSLLADSGFVLRYEVENKTYGMIPSFTQHQRITGSEALSESKHPKPPIGKKRGNTKETLRKHSGNTLDDRKGKEGKGREQGREGKGETGIFPTQEFEIDLSEIEIGKAVEYLTLTKQVTADRNLVLSIWSTFKIKNFTGQKFYKTDREIIGHFFESLKFQQLNGTTAHKSNSSDGNRKLGTSEARINTAKNW